MALEIAKLVGHSVHHFGTDRNISTNSGRIDMKLTFASQTEMSHQLWDG